MTEALIGFFIGITIVLIAFSMTSYYKVHQEGYVSSNELHWNHRDITYQVKGCNPNEKSRIDNAFNIIQNKLNNSINFTGYTDNPDILLICTQSSSNDETDTAGDAYYEYRGSEISSAKITFYNIEGEYGHAGTLVGSYPETEIHEILHTLGVEHINNLNSIMNPIQMGVVNIDEEIVQNLSKIYSKNSTSLSD